MDALRALNGIVNLFARHINEIRIKEASRWFNIGWNTPSDTFHDFEINYSLSGTRAVTFPDGVFASEPGSVVFIDSSEASSCTSGTFAFAYFLFEFEDSVGRNAEAYRQMSECFRALRVLNGRTPDASGPEKLLLEVGEEFIGKSEHRDWAAKLTALSFLIKLHRQLAAEKRGDDPRQQHKYAELVSDLSSYLAEQLDKELTLDQLGQRYGLNPRYLNRIFKAATGHPIFHYQQLLRIELAKKLLRTSSLRVIDIAMEIGLDSSRYFSTLFRKTTGMTPTAYRNQRM